MLQIVFGVGFIEWGLHKGKMTYLETDYKDRKPGVCVVACPECALQTTSRPEK